MRRLPARRNIFKIKFTRGKIDKFRAKKETLPRVRESPMKHRRLGYPIFRSPPAFALWWISRRAFNPVTSIKYT
jgi:hypothetical protein